MNPKLIEDMGWRMSEVYAAIVDRILINLARHFQRIKPGQKVPGAFEYQVKRLAEMGQVTRETEEIILKSLGSADEALQDMLEEAIRDGLQDAEPGLIQVAKKRLSMGQGFLPPEVHPKQTQAFQAYYRQSADKLNLVNTVMLESTQQAYQETVSDIVNRISRTQGILNTETGEVVTGVTSFNQAVRDSVKRMSDNGLTGFVDHGGHRWSPEAYVAMDIRSTMANTAREAVWERSEEYGCELYQVSWHNGARPLCYPWQGKVISKNGWTGEVEDDEGNKIHVYAETETSYGEPAGLFGINCGHYPIPFFPGFSRIRPPQQNETENAKEYEESQKQRQLERKLRNEKRDLEVLKAQGAPEDEIKAQRVKVKAARDNLNEFCEETGRARRSGREYRPIQAEYPKEKALKSTTIDGMMNTKLESSANIPPSMDKERFSRMRNGLEQQGLEVVQAKGDDLRYLQYRGAEASYWDGRITYTGEVPSASAMFEEIIHSTQARVFGEASSSDPIEVAAREIAAQEKLLKHGAAYGFTEQDFADITANRKKWADRFQSLTGKEYDPDDRTSPYYRGF